MNQEKLSKIFILIDGQIYKRKNNRGYDKPQLVRGSLNKGYRWLKVDGSTIGYHRALWILANGDIPDRMVVDHIDRNTLNNSLDNLRLATRSQNSMNAKGKEGAKFAKNVYLDHQWKGSRKYRAQVTFNGKVVRVGGYESKSEAEEMAKALRKFLHGEFAIKEGDVE